MNKVFKKIMAVALSAAMCVGLVGTALADDVTATNTASDKGTITVSGLEDGVTVTAYQIVKADYDSVDSQFSGYEMCYSTEDTSNTLIFDRYGNYEESALTEENLAMIFEQVSSSPYGDSVTADSDGVATFSGMSVGSYLFVVTNSEATVYGMVIGSVSYNSSAGTVDGGEIDVTVPATVEGETVWMKSTTPTLTKTEHHEGGNGTHGESTNLGDEITFDITISSIPSYQGEYPVFDVDDTLSGLTISEEELEQLSVKIMNGEETVATLEKDKDYTVTPVGDEAPYTEFDVNFVVNNSYTLNDYAVAGYTIVIEYPATVVDATYNDGVDELTNDAVLTYATTSYVNHNEGNNTGESEDEDYEYDFEVDFLKTDGTDPLAGATFGLFTDASCLEAYTQNGIAVTAESILNSDETAATVTFTGLAEGTYYLRETEAPAGYALNETVYTVVIEAEYNADGSLDTWTITVSGDTIEDGSIIVTGTSATGLTVINTRLGTLPSMGSTGIALCVIAGCVVLAGAVAGVAIYRRKNNAEV